MTPVMPPCDEIRLSRPEGHVLKNWRLCFKLSKGSALKYPTLYFKLYTQVAFVKTQAKFVKTQAKFIKTKATFIKTQAASNF